jgi:hypothetical protein
MIGSSDTDMAALGAPVTNELRCAGDVCTRRMPWQTVNQLQRRLGRVSGYMRRWQLGAGMELRQQRQRRRQRLQYWGIVVLIATRDSLRCASGTATPA